MNNTFKIIARTLLWIFGFVVSYVYGGWIVSCVLHTGFIQNAISDNVIIGIGLLLFGSAFGIVISLVAGIVVWLVVSFIVWCLTSLVGAIVHHILTGTFRINKADFDAIFEWPETVYNRWIK